MLISNRNFALEEAARDLVEQLGGSWHDSHGMCLCPAHSDRDPSLSIRAGERSLLFKCFAGCETIDVIRALRGLRHAIPQTVPTSSPALVDPNAARRRAAARIWDEAEPITGGPALAYLVARHLPLGNPRLRFHPRTPLGRGARAQYRPAIITALSEGRELIAIQRLFLNPIGPRLATDLPKPKLTLGRPMASAVKLWRVGRCLALAEGVETAMSAKLLLGIPVWATLGAERLHRIRIPDRVRHIVLLPDRDRAGLVAARRACATYEAMGKHVRVQWPWDGFKDWNDVLLRSQAQRGKGE